LLTGVTWMVLDRRATDVAAAEHEADALSIALAEQTSRTFGAVDVVLRDLLARIQVAGVSSPADLGAVMGTADIQKQLNLAAGGLPELAMVGLVGADGRLINFSQQWPVADSRLDDRDFYLALRDGARIGSFISAPSASHSADLLTIYMSHRINAPDGRFLGAVIAGIRQAYLTDFYRSILPAEGREILLRRSDGELLVRFPARPPGLPETPGDEAAFRQDQQGASSVRAATSILTDGVRWFTVTRSVNDFPLVIVLARATSSMLAGWRAQTVAILASAAIAIATLVAVIFLLGRQIARRETSEKAFAATFAQMSQGIMMIAGDRQVLLCNERATEMLELPRVMMASKPSLDELLSFQRARGEFDSGLVAAASDLILSGVLSGAPHTSEHRRPNGTMIEIESIPLVSGGAVCTFTDVTAAREREAVLRSALRDRDANSTSALAASEARHRDVAEIASDWFWETDGDGRVTFLSPRFEEVSGVPAARVLGHPFYADEMTGIATEGPDVLLLTIQAHTAFRDKLQRVIVAGRGTRFWRLSGKPFFDSATGAFAGFRGTGTDATVEIEHTGALNLALWRAEAAQREAREARSRLVDAIEAIPEGVVLHDSDDRLVLCNARFGEIYDFAPELMRPGVQFEQMLRDSVARGYYTAETADIEAWITNRLTQRRTSDGLSEEHQLSNGRWLQIAERPTSDGGIVGIRIDVTEARQREAAQHDREKLAALGQLAGGIAHEINNLLQPALVLPEIVSDRLPESDTESREDLECIIDGARRVRDIVRNVLLFARGEEARLVPLDLVAEVRASLDFVRTLMPPSITVRTQGLDAHPGGQVAANKTQLTQVLTNLLVNASHATAGTDGVVTVAIETVAPSHELATELGLDAARLYFAVSVGDNGCGIPAAVLARIFEPFFTTKPVGQGTGLGLSVAYGILKGWQGGITARSSLGLGTVFILYVPMIDPPTIASESVDRTEQRG
jgi:PAS domain S-box-containing protein